MLYQQPKQGEQLDTTYCTKAFLAFTPNQPSGRNDASPYAARDVSGWGTAVPNGSRLHSLFDGSDANRPAPPTKTNSQNGMALVFDGSRLLYNANIVGKATGASPDETFIVDVDFTTNSGDQILLGYFSRNFGIEAYGRGLALSGGVIKAIGVSASNGKIVSSGITPVVGQRYVIAARFSVDGAIFVNGQKIASGDLSHAWNYMLSIGAVTDASTTGSFSPTGTTYFNGRMRGAWALSGGLSDAELRSITVNPWQLHADQDEEDEHTLYVQTGGGPQTYSYTGVGGLVLSGTVAAVKNSIKFPNGGVQFAGTLTNVRGRSVQPSGGIVYGGIASVFRGALRAVTGGLTLAGNAAIIPFSNLQNRIITPVGGLMLAGGATVLRSLSRIPGGGLIFSGAANIQRSSGGVIVVLGQLNDIIWTKLRIKGGVGTRNDMLNENTYWRALGDTSNSINQVEKNTLTSLGKTGALNEQEKDYWSNL